MHASMHSFVYSFIQSVIHSFSQAARQAASRPSVRRSVGPSLPLSLHPSLHPSIHPSSSSSSSSSLVVQSGWDLRSKEDKTHQIQETLVKRIGKLLSKYIETIRNLSVSFGFFGMFGIFRSRIPSPSPGGYSLQRADVP